MIRALIVSILINIALFCAWQSEKGERIAQEARFLEQQREKEVQDDKSISVQKKIAVLRKKEAKPEKADCDCLSSAVSDDVIEWLRS